jgi:hypothetical protein
MRAVGVLQPAQVIDYFLISISIKLALGNVLLSY